MIKETLKQVNDYETDFLWEELWTQNPYLSHFELPDNATVVDFGANIGLFSLKVLERYNNSRVICIEPGKRSFACLKKNLSSYTDRVSIQRKALTDSDTRVQFVDYQNYSTISGIHTDLRRDSKVIFQGASHFDKTVSYAETMTKLQDSEKYEVPGISINSFLRQCPFMAIDLMKVDVEGAESSLLLADERLFAEKIKRCVIETHSPELHAKLSSFLTRIGFKVTTSLDPILKDAGIALLSAENLP